MRRRDRPDRIEFGPALTWSPGTSEALAGAGRATVLLVACDYDGTIAPIVDEPSNAHPHRGAIAGLRGLANLPDTHVAVISGRSLADLAVLSRLPDEVHLVGSHGSEFEPGAMGQLTPEQRALLRRVESEMIPIQASTGGCQIESKPSGVAFHYRRAGVDDGSDIVKRIVDGPGSLPGVFVRHGKFVVELSVVETNKGEALDRVRHAVGADTVVFIGDDRTDEDAFARLRGPDVGIKVGEGETLAPFRVDDPEDVCGLLGRLLDDRSAWVAGHRAPPIERHTLLSDHRTVALLDPSGRISWLCHPRSDSQAIFAELIGGPTAGYFAVRPSANGGAPLQRYISETLAVETQWRTHRVTDYLHTSTERSAEDAGRSRLIRVIEGRGDVEIVFAPRPNYGRNVVEIEAVDGGLAVVGGIETIRLVAPDVKWDITDEGARHTARAVVDPAGGPIVLELCLGAESTKACDSEIALRDATMDYWREISQQLKIPPVAPTLVRRSALILEALRYRPSGAMIAAATTSLPETIGGMRNWDYRYCWPRDASMSCTSLVKLGRAAPGLELLDWLCERVTHATRPDLLRPLYHVTGDEPVPEGVVAEMTGYAGSRPVRIGNAAENQVQLDALGPVVELVYQIFQAGHGIRPSHWDLTVRIADVVLEHWQLPDHGIWELRLARQHNVVSKMMCWLVLDRAIRLAGVTGREVPDTWHSARSAIVDEIHDRGWNPDIRSFTATYDGSSLDAGLLMMGVNGFIDPADERFVSTVSAVEAELCEGPAVFRYRDDDGLSGAEGGMLVCTGWLVQALVACGRGAEAQDWFDRLIIPAGPTGLLPEQIDPVSERSLGNVPQAYSHLAVIDAALALAASGVVG